MILYKNNFLNYLWITFFSDILHHFSDWFIFSRNNLNHYNIAIVGSIEVIAIYENIFSSKSIICSYKSKVLSFFPQEIANNRFFGSSYYITDNCFSFFAILLKFNYFYFNLISTECIASISLKNKVFFFIVICYNSIILIDLFINSSCSIILLLHLGSKICI